MPEAMAASRREQAIAEFGPPNSDNRENGAKWKLDSTRLDDAVAFEASGPKSEDGRLDPSQLYVHFRFRWRPPWAGNGNEALGVFLASLDSPEFREQLTALESAVPFKFNDNYFKRWVITPKRGNAGRILKAPTGWRKQWMVS
jgi:hypothetical protein